MQVSGSFTLENAQAIAGAMADKRCQLVELDFLCASFTCANALNVLFTALSHKNSRLKNLKLYRLPPPAAVDEIMDTLETLSKSVACPSCKLEELSVAVSEGAMTVERLAVIANVVKTSHSIKKLDIGSCDLDVVKMAALSQLLINPSCQLKELSLQCNDLVTKHAESGLRPIDVLMDALSSAPSSLRCLDLRRTTPRHIEGNDAEIRAFLSPIARALKYSGCSLEEVNLANNYGFSPDNLGELADSAAYREVVLNRPVNIILPTPFSRVSDLEEPKKKHVEFYESIKNHMETTAVMLQAVRGSRFPIFLPAAVSSFLNPLGPEADIKMYHQAQQRFDRARQFRLFEESGGVKWFICCRAMRIFARE